MPKVTVLMPTYNVGPWVEKAVRSVLDQTYRDFKLLVVDDASTDDTLARVRAIDDPRIRIASFPDNVGLAENLNRGLDLIDTEYFARMDGDDIALPQWLQREVEYLEAHPEVGVCGGGGQRFGTSQSLIRFPEQHDDIAANMLFECTIIVPTVRMSVVRQHGLRYRADAFPAEDYRFWADCLRVTQLHNIPDTLFRYRMHASQICSSRRREQESKVAEVRLYMLDWLNPDCTNEEKQYFTNTFAPCKIRDIDEIKKMVHFSHLLTIHNSQSHISAKALYNKLRLHIGYGTLDYVEHNYFTHRYTPIALAQVIRDGLYPLLPPKIRPKIIAKCIFLKNKR